ncbi:MAG: DUF1080 domain-containing protein [Bryobacteraceae bacterium]
MKNLALLLLVAALPLCAADGDWVSLFNGKDLTGWKANENPETFTVQDSAIVSHGPRSHCFYVGSFNNHVFRNFDLTVDVMTLPRANGGIYILTELEGPGWPGKGFEAQVNNTFPGDPRKTGSLYEVQDVGADQNPVKDNEWFTEEVIVQGDTITVKLNGKQLVHWTQPAGWAGTSDFPGRRIAPGTIALQGHDAGSTVYYKNIRIKLLK